MKIRKKVSFLLFFMLIAFTTTHGAAFRQLSPLINIPTAETFKAGDIEFLGSLSISAPTPSVTGSAQTVAHDFDFMVNYTFTDRLKAGIAMYTNEQYGGYLHSTFFHNGVLGIGAGITHMTEKEAISSRDDFPVTKQNNFTSYLTFSLNFLAGKLHLGIGNGEFINADGSNGMFYGLELPGLGGAFLLEHDGRNIHFGYRINASEQTNVYVAHTEINPLEEVNKEYNNAPKRYFAFGASIRQNLSNFYASQQDEIADYKAKFRELEDDYLRLKDEIGLEKEMLAESRKQFEFEVKGFKDLMAKLLEEERERVPTANLEDQTDRFVLELYNKSFEKYQEKNYFKAIELLSDAIDLKPNAAFLYIRLGSIYYEIGRRDLALKSWETALEYDPKNEELINLLTQ